MGILALEKSKSHSCKMWIFKMQTYLDNAMFGKKKKKIHKILLQIRWSNSSQAQRHFTTVWATAQKGLCLWMSSKFPFGRMPYYINTTQPVFKIFRTGKFEVTWIFQNSKQTDTSTPFIGTRYWFKIEDFLCLLNKILFKRHQYSNPGNSLWRFCQSCFHVSQ